MVWVFFSLNLNLKAKMPEMASDMGKPVVSIYLGFVCISGILGYLGAHQRP